MQIRILGGGAVKGLVDAMTPALLREHGATIAGTFGAVGAMRDLLRSGEPADLVMLTRVLIAELEAAGDVVAGSAVDIGAVATAVAVRGGDARPDVGTPQKLRAALLEASDIHFPDPKLATAGIHVARTIAALGIEADVVAKLCPYPNGATAMAAMARATSDRPIGITQASEILATSGVALVAPLPEPHALSTVYTAALASRAVQPEVARRFVGMLCSTGAARQRAAAGFSEPGTT